MLSTDNSNVLNGRLQLRTFVVFGIVLLVTIGSTWWITKANNDKRIVDTVFDRLDSTIHEMNHLLLRDNKMKDDEMTSWLSYPEKRDRAQIWKPKLDSVVWLGIAFHDYMLSCRTSLLNDIKYQKANKAMFDGIRDSALSIQQKLFSVFPENKKYNLQDSLIEKELKQIATNNYYTGLSLSGRLAVLTKIEHSILESTNNMADYISQQIAYHPIAYDAFDVLIVQNTTYLLPGQTLEISAGLGSFSTAAKPKIVVDGKEQVLNSSGVGTYRKPVTAKDGNGGTITASVSFKDPQTGQQKTISKNVSYTIFQHPKN